MAGPSVGPTDFRRRDCCAFVASIAHPFSYFEPMRAPKSGARKWKPRCRSFFRTSACAARATARKPRNARSIRRPSDVSAERLRARIRQMLDVNPRRPPSPGTSGEGEGDVRFSKSGTPPPCHSCEARHRVATFSALARAERSAARHAPWHGHPAHVVRFDRREGCDELRKPTLDGARRATRPRQRARAFATRHTPHAPTRAGRPCHVCYATRRRAPLSRLGPLPRRTAGGDRSAKQAR